MPSPETNKDKTQILSGTDSKQGEVKTIEKQSDNKSSPLKLPQLTAGERAEPRGFPANENETLMLMQGWERRRQALANQSKQHLPFLIMLAGSTLSAMWLAAAVVYVHNTVGWQNVAKLMPHEIGGFLAGLLAPMALFWMVLTFWLRSVDVKLYAETLRHEIQAMIFPSEEAEKRVNNDIDRLMRQTAEMSRATRNALVTLHKARQAMQGETQAMQSGAQQTADRLADLEKRLAARHDALQVLQQNMDAKSQTLAEASQKLVEDAAHLNQTTEKTAETSQIIRQVLQAPLQDLQQWQQDVVQALKDSMARIAQQQQELRVDIDDIEDKATHVAGILQKGTSRIYDFTDDALDKAKLIETRLQGQGLALEQVLAQINAQANILGERHQKIMDDLQSHTHDGQKSLFDNAQLIEKLLGQMGYARDALKNTMGEISETATLSSSQIMDTAHSVQKTFDEAAHASVDHITQALQQLQDKMGIAVEYVKTGIADASNSSVERVATSLAQLKEAVEKTAHDARDAMQHQSVLSAEHVNQSLVQLKTSLEQSAQDAANTLTTASQHVQDHVSGNTQEALQKILASMQDMQDKLGAVTQQTTTSLTDTAHSVKLEMSEHTQHTIERLANLFTHIKDGVGSVTHSAVDNLTEVATRLRAELTDTIDKTSALTKDNVTYLSERTAGYVTQFSALVTAASDRAMEQSRQLVADTREALAQEHVQTRELVDELIAQNKTSLAETAESFSVLRDRIKSLIDDVAGREKSLVSTGDQVVSQADHVRDILSEAFARVSTTTEQLQGQVDILAESLTQPLDRLDGASTHVLEQAQIVGNIFEQKISAMQDMSAGLQHVAEDMSADMDARATSLKDSMIHIQTSISAIKSDLSDHAQTLDHRVKAMLSQVTIVLPQLDRVGTHLTSLNEETHKTHDQLVQLDRTLQHNAQNLITVSDDTAKRVQDSLSRYAELGQRYEAVSEAGLGALQAAHERYESSAERLEESTQQARTGLDQINSTYDTLAQTLGTLDQTIVAGHERAERAVAAMHDVQNTLAKTAQAVEEQTGKSVSDINALHHTLDQAHDSFVQRAVVLKEIARQSEEQAGKLVAQTEQLNATTQSNTDILEKTTQTLRETLTESGAQAQQVEIFNREVETLNSQMRQQRDLIRQQSEALEKAAQDAVDKAAHIRSLEQSLQRDHFFSSAKFVVESLHSLALDFTRMLDGELPEKTWKAYQRGETSVFTKRLVSARDQLSHDKLRQKFEQDAEFRTYVQRYFRQFEEMHDQAKTHDHGDLLSSVFISSDVGRLYQFLQDVLKKS